MGRDINDVIADLPVVRQRRIEARYRQLKHEIESLRELRQLAGKAQADIAATLKIKQPSVSKIEKQTDMYLSTLRSYVEAIGGELELTVKLPRRPWLRIRHLGEPPESEVPTSESGARPRRKRAHEAPAR